ncbi:unnamed protein product [Phaedon cochleariae]|uniref:SH2 domain-containing protein n=1 Tax=Phaedon cochleariae TaxID=80249 RepID=A0A9P0GPM4_PHACE|nr:unnamed protein product [Phaedon cochleariae]
MGRLGKSSPAVTVNYRKLVDEHSSSCDSLRIMPALPDFFSYSCHQCGHKQKLQAEELNSILGNAFKMAYAAQLQKQSSFQDVIATQLEQSQTDKVLWTKELSASHRPSAPSATMEREDGGPTVRANPPSSIPGLNNPLHQNRFGGDKSASQLSTPSSDESNSPTEMNSYKRMAEKPPLIKRIAMGLTGGSGRNDEDSCPLVGDANNPSTPNSPTNRPLSGGYVNETEESRNRSINNAAENLKNEQTDAPNITKHIEPSKTDRELKTKRISQISSSSSSSGQHGTQDPGFTRYPPLPPERTDSLTDKEEEELRIAPWYQAGIPREIALEILAREPVGAFMVRQSTSKPGCFALSLRVPRTFQPTGIAHYLIVRVNKSYKIKGFTKEFISLTSLITHHSVMPELLPCPLSLSRYLPNFAKSDSKRDFADIDLDPDYNCFTDFRKMMADI